MNTCWLIILSIIKTRRQRKVLFEQYHISQVTFILPKDMLFCMELTIVFFDITTIFHLIGFCITPIFSNTGGCEIGYVTHSNPKGRLPTWVTNKLSTSLAPKFIKWLHKACIEYPSWKQKNDPSIKWWLNPEQRTTPKINIELDVMCYLLQFILFFNK